MKMKNHHRNFCTKSQLASVHFEFRVVVACSFFIYAQIETT